MKGIALLAALAAPCISAQDWARERVEKSPRHREWISVKHNGRAVESFVVYPEVARKTPVVIVIHEIFGLTDWIQDVADQLAEAGYIAIAPDLLSGMGPNGGRTTSIPSNQVGEIIGKLNPDQITADLNAVADYARKIPAADGTVFVSGFCWGGGQSFRFAGNRPDLRAAFVFYGPPPDRDTLSRIKAPVHGFYGANDMRIDASIPETEKQMKALGKTYEPVIYEGAGHGFMRTGEAPLPANADEAARKAWEANRKARDDAWARWKKLLAR